MKNEGNQTEATGDTESSSTEQVAVREVRQVTEELLASIAKLVPQLSKSAEPLTFDQLTEIVESGSSILLVAEDDKGNVIGSLTLGVFRVPTGIRAWIEDVVVDGAARGAGVGSALVRFAIDRSLGLGARSVDLTSRPSRIEANRLYVKLGFEARETNVYRWKVE